VEKKRTGTGEGRKTVISERVEEERGKRGGREGVRRSDN
jgi:hypothetical protein